MTDLIQNYKFVTCVYVMYSKDHTVLYVGKTRHLEQRLRCHFHPSQKDYADWKKDVDYIQYFPFKTQADIDIMEVYCIHKFQPRYNTDGNAKHDLSINLDKALSKKHIIHNIQTLAIPKVHRDSKLRDQTKIVYSNKLNICYQFLQLERLLRKHKPREIKLSVYFSKIYNTVFNKKTKTAYQKLFSRHKTQLEEIAQKYNYTYVNKARSKIFYNNTYYNNVAISYLMIQTKSKITTKSKKAAKQGSNSPILQDFTISSLSEFEKAMTNLFSATNSNSFKIKQICEAWHLSRYKFQQYLAQTHVPLALKGHSIILNKS